MQVLKAHNDYLQIAAECGVGALFIFLCLWGRQFYLAGKSDRRFADEYLHLQLGYTRTYLFYLLALGENSVPHGE
jgi:O-antigen ligase